MIKKLNKNQWFTDIEGLCPIPSNSIISKNLTGLGGTTAEINALRNSIIVLPNVPVIIGKSSDNEKVQGVYSAVTNKQIIDYFTNQSITHKKFLTTPESFERIINLGLKLNIDVYKDYFLLFDECERVNKDVGYRSKIVDPLKHLSLFSNYAFISATTIPFSNPRLKNLRGINLIPSYDIANDIDLICTNHPYECLKCIIENTEKKVFVFCSSLRVISKALEYCKIDYMSAVFCSDQRIDDLPNGLGYADTMIYEENFEKVNFFTSRFFSAVDINYDQDCEIVILSDVKSVAHSAIDPKTDAVQIIGRFRDKNSQKAIYVITNCNENIEFMSNEEIDIYLKTSGYLYKKILTEVKTRPESIQRRVFEEYLKVVPFNRFLDDDGTVSYYLMDNFRYENKVLSIYKSYDSILKSYINCKIDESNIPYFNVHFTREDFEVSSEVFVSQNSLKTYRDKIIYVSNILNNLLTPQKKYNDISEKFLMLDKLKYHYPEIFEAFTCIGYEELMNFYSKNEVMDAVKKFKQTNALSDKSLTSDILNSFKEGEIIEGKVIKDKLSMILERNKIVHIYPTLQFLRNYFDIPKKGVKGKGNNRNKTFYKIGKKI